MKFPSKNYCSYIPHVPTYGFSIPCMFTFGFSISVFTSSLIPELQVLLVCLFSAFSFPGSRGFCCYSLLGCFRRNQRVLSTLF